MNHLMPFHLDIVRFAMFQETDLSTKFGEWPHMCAILNKVSREQPFLASVSCS